MDDTKNIFGSRLLEVREERGESQQELADSIGITRQSLSRYELGERTANIDLLKKVAEHYNVSADYLLGLTDNKTTDIDLQAVCEFTGLSDNAILTINKNADEYKNPMLFLPEHKADKQFYYVLNNVLCSDFFYTILHYFFDIHTCSRQIFYITLIENIFDYIEDKYNIYFYGNYSCLSQSLELDVDRYKISKDIEKISDIFDGRVKINQLNNKELLFYSELTRQELQEIIRQDLQEIIEKDSDISKNVEVINLLSSSAEISKIINEILEVTENYRSFVEKERARRVNEMEMEQNGKHNPTEE